MFDDDGDEPPEPTVEVVTIDEALALLRREDDAETMRTLAWNRAERAQRMN